MRPNCSRAAPDSTGIENASFLGNSGGGFRALARGPRALPAQAHTPHPKPDGSHFDIELPNSLDPRLGDRATIPAVALTHRGVYDVVVRCDVSGSARAQHGESIFAERLGPDGFTIEPDVTVQALGPVTVDVQGQLNVGDRANVWAASPQELLLYSNGTQMRIGVDVLLTGLVVAPEAVIDVYSNTLITGCIGGEDVNLEPDVLLDGTDAVLPLVP